MNGGVDNGEEPEQPQAAPQAAPQATLLTSALVLPPSRPVEETKQRKGVVEYEASPPPKPPPPTAHGDWEASTLIFNVVTSSEAGHSSALWHMCSRSSASSSRSSSSNSQTRSCSSDSS